MESFLKECQQSMSDMSASAARTTVALQESSDMLTFVTLKLLKAKTNSNVTKIGDEIKVTYTIEIGDVKYTGKATTAENCEQAIHATKREARCLAFEKFVDAKKYLIDLFPLADIDRLIDSMN